MKTIRIEVHGRVQGVFFRVNVKAFADREGIKGDVRNRDDGSVEIVAQGSKMKLDKLIKWIRNSPGFSKVERVLVDGEDAKRKFRDFKMAKQ